MTSGWSRSPFFAVIAAVFGAGYLGVCGGDEGAVSRKREREEEEEEAAEEEEEERHAPGWPRASPAQAGRRSSLGSARGRRRRRQRGAAEKRARSRGGAGREKWEPHSTGARTALARSLRHSLTDLAHRPRPQTHRLLDLVVCHHPILEGAPGAEAPARVETLGAGWKADADQGQKAGGSRGGAGAKLVRGGGGRAGRSGGRAGWAPPQKNSSSFPFPRGAGETRPHGRDGGETAHRRRRSPRPR